LSEELAQNKTNCATIFDAQARALKVGTEDGFNPSVPLWPPHRLPWWSRKG